MTSHVVVAENQVTAALENGDGTQNVYITRDPAVNALTLTLTNGLANAIVFPPGTPAEYGTLPAGQSAVYIFLSGLIGNADVASITLSTPGWTMGTFTDPTSTFQYLVLAPVSQVSVPAGGPLSFKFGHVLVAGTPRSGTADVELAGASSVTPMPGDVSLFVNIANPPQPGNKQLDVKVQIDFDPRVVYTVPSQSLVLHLVNNGQTPLVPGGTDSWKGATPTFQLTLIYGDSAGSLTTVADAADIGMHISDGYGNIWQPVQRYKQGDRPYWIMQPDPNGGGTVLGTLDQAAIEFLVDGINATLPDGLNEALTVAYVSWHSVPGYDDGCKTLIITKKAGPKVTLFTADPGWMGFDQPSIRTVLTWAAENAADVRFDAPGVDPAQAYYIKGTGPIEGGITVPHNTTVTVTAYIAIPSARGLAQPAERAPGNIISATASLLITSPSCTDVPVGIGSLGSIVIPSGGTRAFLFQMGSGQLTEAAVLDLNTHAVTSTLDLNSLIPSKGGATQIDSVVPSPDGTTIHVLVSSGHGASNLTPEYYILPLHVAGAAYGTPVSLGTMVPSGQAFMPTVITTPDGRTLCVSMSDDTNGTSYICALDAASYAIKGSWSWQPVSGERLPPTVVFAAANDSSKLLMWNWAGLLTADVAGGFAAITFLNIAGEFKLLVGPPVVSPDGTRAYLVGIDGFKQPRNCSLVIVDVDLATGALNPAKVIKLGVLPPAVGSMALSPDAKRLYLQTDSDALTVCDTTTFAVAAYTCAVNGQFTPVVMALGTQPKLVYATGHSNSLNGTLTIVTLP